MALGSRSTARLDGPTFVQMCVLGWMNNASASYSQLNHVVASLDLHVRNQAIEERFGPAGSSLMRHEQVFLTATDLSSFPEEIVGQAHIYEVREGEVVVAR